MSILLFMLLAVQGQSIRWEKGAPGTDLIVRDGVEEASIDSGGLVIGVSLRRHNWDYLNKNYLVQVRVKNGTEQRVEIDPSSVSLVDVGKKKSVGSVAVERLVSMHGTAPSESWSRYLGQNQSAEALKAQSTAQWLTSGALRRNTVMPGQEISGAAWFKQDGKQLLVVIWMDGTIFEFPFAF